MGSDMKRLEGQIALVTGGGSGIGLAVARAFLQEGAKVAITGRTEAKLRRAAESLPGQDRLFASPADVSDPAQVAVLVQHVTERLGPISILVNNAGQNIKERALRELTPETWQKMIRANLDSAFYCLYAILPGMLQRHNGTIINISSTAGKRASPLGGAAYSAAKFGLSALGLCLAAEEKDSGIRVCNIYPGEVDTPILEARPQPISAEHRQRILQPEDVAAAVLFVATLPPRASVPELVIKPTTQLYL
jgi:NAD(P)-dependent dehydrogenase (short-subunit alcohol dehydrogenase family)